MLGEAAGRAHRARVGMRRGRGSQVVLVDAIQTSQASPWDALARRMRPAWVPNAVFGPQWWGRQVVGSYRLIFLVGGKWSVRPSELEKSAAKGVPSIHGYRYYISFVDDTTRQVVLYYMKTKDEAFEKVKHYLTYIERQGQKCPKAVCTDNGHEYVNKDLIGWCHSKGIELQTTAPHTPEQNGVAERWNRTVVELGCAMIIARKLPSELWPEVMSYATYIQNCAYTRAVPDMTPYQKWSGK
jgi:transposase InsO family protein